MRSLLITGASGRLARILVKKITHRPKNIKHLALTSRYPERLNFPGSFITYHTLNFNKDFYSSSFFSELKQLPPFDSILHCASPYPTEPLMLVPAEELSECTQAIAQEMCLLRELTSHLKSNGSLIVCGSVSGMRADIDFPDDVKTQLSHISHIGNFGRCSLHAMHKGIIRDFTNCLYQSNLDKAIVYANLGAFMTEVPKGKEDEILSAAVMAEKIMELMQAPRSNTFSVDIVSNTTAKKLALLQTTISKEGSRLG